MFDCKKENTFFSEIKTYNVLFPLYGNYLYDTVLAKHIIWEKQQYKQNGERENGKHSNKNSMVYYRIHNQL